MIWWSGDMVARLECVNMVLGWNYATIVLFSKWLNGEIIIWCNGDMVELSNGESFSCGHITIDYKIVKWWRISIIQWIVWLDSTVAWVISYVLVSLIFEQHANDVYPDKYGEARLCYLWCLLVYLLFCHVTFPFSPMMKRCNVEMVPDDAVMMVRIFWCRGSILVLE